MNGCTVKPITFPMERCRLDTVAKRPRNPLGSQSRFANRIDAVALRETQDEGNRNISAHPKLWQAHGG